MALVYQCPNCGASNEVKTRRVFDCWKCHEKAPDRVARDIRLALDRRTPTTLLVVACVSLYIALPLGVDVVSVASAGIGPALSGAESCVDLAWIVVSILCFVGVWRECRWVRWPALLGVAALAFGYIAVALSAVWPGHAVDLGPAATLGPLGAALGASFVYLVWFFFRSERARDYYAAVARSPRIPKFRFHRRASAERR
jgi:hypothetical protein